MRIRDGPATVIVEGWPYKATDPAVGSGRRPVRRSESQETCQKSDERTSGEGKSYWLFRTGRLTRLRLKSWFVPLLFVLHPESEHSLSRDRRRYAQPCVVLDVSRLRACIVGALESNNSWNRRRQNAGPFAASNWLAQKNLELLFDHN